MRSALLQCSSLRYRHASHEILQIFVVKPQAHPDERSLSLRVQEIVVAGVHKEGLSQTVRGRRLYVHVPVARLVAVVVPRIDAELEPVVPEIIISPDAARRFDQTEPERKVPPPLRVLEAELE